MFTRCHIPVRRANGASKLHGNACGIQALDVASGKTRWVTRAGSQTETYLPALWRGSLLAVRARRQGARTRRDIVRVSLGSLSASTLPNVRLSSGTIVNDLDLRGTQFAVSQADPVSVCGGASTTSTLTQVLRTRLRTGSLSGSPVATPATGCLPSSAESPLRGFTSLGVAREGVTAVVDAQDPATGQLGSSLRRFRSDGAVAGTSLSAPSGNLVAAATDGNTRYYVTASGTRAHITKAATSDRWRTRK